MSAYLIVDITIHDPARYQDYVSQVPALIKKHQGTYLVRGGEVEIKEGNWRPNRVIVLEFPTRAQANDFLEDSDYQTLAAIRHAATTSNAILVEGYKAP